RLDRPSAEAAPAIVVDERVERIAALDLIHAGPLDVPRDRYEPCSRILLVADLLERFAAVRDDPCNVRQRLDVIDDGGLLIEAAHRETGRPIARIPALALDRCKERGRFAPHIGTRTAIDDEITGEVGAENPRAEV